MRQPSAGTQRGAVSRAAIALALALTAQGVLPRAASHAGDPPLAEQLAPQVTIYRDAWGVPHIDGQTDEAVMFGFAYAQAEDNFWQIEDSYALALGRYAEVHGPRGLNSDLLNRAFEIVPSARNDFARLPEQTRSLSAAFVAGLNHYLAKHPHVKPRLITRFAPWHPLALTRHVFLEIAFRYTHLASDYKPRMNPLIWSQAGSNAWAIGPSRTKSGKAMLLVNPHQPQFGFGQLYEAHLKSGEGWSLSGGAMLGSMLPSMGHTQRLGWALTTNEPDIADVWRVAFDDPGNPLRYRDGDSHRTAAEWRETIHIRRGEHLSSEEHVFRKTHHGPVLKCEGDGRYLTARIAGLYDSQMLEQALQMARARDLTEFQVALAMGQFPLMNVIYADQAGNIGFFYNGRIPRRDPAFDWTQPIDGGDPRTAWQGFHAVSELPKLINPPCGYVQNCNSSPFTTTERDNPDQAAYPAYMLEDAAIDRRRAKMSRRLLEAMRSITLDDLERAAFDTTIYWAVDELPRMVDLHASCETSHPELARRVRPYLEHLLAWDGRCAADSTQATLCEAWYAELYGDDYPGETLKPLYERLPEQKLAALLRAAASLESMHGDWKVPWGDIHRLQRHASVADFLTIPFADEVSSLPCVAVPGPMGAVFTQYYTPSIDIPYIKTMRQRFGVVGTTYLGVFEFGETVDGRVLHNFGQSGDAASPHFFDQAALHSQQRLRPELFVWDEIKSQAVRSYQP